MAGKWKGSDRRSRLPANWTSICHDVKTQDGNRCMVIMDNGHRCPVTDNLQVDHINRGDDHRRENLRTICEAHHALKSSAEGNEAQEKRRAEIHNRFRRRESHPGSR